MLRCRYCALKLDLGDRISITAIDFRRSVKHPFPLIDLHSDHYYWFTPAEIGRFHLRAAGSICNVCDSHSGDQLRTAASTNFDFLLLPLSAGRVHPLKELPLHSIGKKPTRRRQNIDSLKSFRIRLDDQSPICFLLFHYLVIDVTGNFGRCSTTIQSRRFSDRRP